MFELEVGGVPPGEAARWLGNTVETLVSTYVGALQGDDVEARKRVDAAEGAARAWMAAEAKRSYRVPTAETGRRGPTAGKSGKKG